MSGAPSSVRPEQRYAEDRPCPICGGHDRLRRGEGKRCYGFISEDGEWARCSREEHAGDVPYDTNSDAFVHKLTGSCKCGVRHDVAAYKLHSLTGVWDQRRLLFSVNHRVANLTEPSG